MTLAFEVTQMGTEMGGDVKALFAAIGDLLALPTTDKSSVVASISELSTQIGSASGIDDNSTGTAASWSASKVIAELDALRSALEGGAPVTLNDLNEIAAAMNDDPDFANTINTLVSNNATAINTLAANVGDTSTDFLAAYTTARDA